MAYAIKYLFKFESSNGTTREIRVLQDGYTGEVIQRPLGRAPILKKQQNGPVHGTSLKFYAECHVDREFIEFYTSDPKAYRVDLYAGATLLWQGYITPELYSEPDIAPPYDVQVVATDGVGELKLYDYAAQGTVTLRTLLSGLLSHTGLGTDIYLISSLKPGSAGAGSLLEKTINLDYMAGQTCYEVLTYILDTLHATITWWKGAWILTRETNVTFTNGKVRYFNTAGNSALLNDSVQVLGKMYANPAWPVGQLSTVIDPAKNRVTVQAPWHVVTCLRNSDMGSDADWTKAKNARYDTDGYVLPVNINTGTSETAVISQATSMAGLRVPMSLSVKATGATSEITAQVVGAVLGVLLTYKVGNVTYHLVKGDDGVPVWQQGGDIGTYIPLRTRIDFQQPLATWDSSRIEAEELTIDNIPPFLQGTTFPAGTLTVYILGYCAKIYGAYLDVVLPKGYQDILRIDNGARGEGSEVEIAIGRETTDNAYYAAFLQGLLLDSGNLITSFSDANFTSGMDYLAFIARDYALSVALPRAKVTGTVYLESGIAAPPLVFTKGALNYWLQTWSWNLHEDELEIEGLTLPSASLTVESETILESTASASSSTGRVSGGGAPISPGGGTNYWEIDGTLNTLLKPKDAYSYVHSKDGLFFTGATEADFEVVTVQGVGRVIHSRLPFYSDGFISAGGLSSGGGSEGVSLAAVWASLKTNSDDYANEKINAYHIPIGSGLSIVNGAITATNAGAITSVSLAAGATNGTLHLVVNGTAQSDVAVTGLGSMAYASSGDYVPIATPKTITATHTFSNGLNLTTSDTWQNVDRALYFGYPEDDARLSYYNVNSNTGLTYNPATGVLKAGSFVKRGGTSTQFLKADGSVDTNTYLTGITSTMVTTALGYTPWHASNHPTTLSGYGITDSVEFDQDILDLGATHKMGYGYTAHGWPFAGPAMTFGAGKYTAQIQSSANGNSLYYRQTVNGTAQSWVEIYHTGNLTKSVITGLLEDNNGYYVKKSGDTMTGALNVTAQVTPVALEFRNMGSSAGNGGYIDFHFNNSSADFTTRIIESASGILSISGGLSLGTTLQLGNGVLSWDGSANAWKLTGNFYATGFISAGGVSSGGGTSGVDLAVVWANLTANTGEGLNKVINVAHIPDMASTYGYLKSGDISGVYLPLTGGTLKNSTREILALNQETSSTGVTGAYIRFSTNGASKAGVGYNSNLGTFLENASVAGVPHVNIDNSGEFKYKNTYTFLHSGNYSTWVNTTNFPGLNKTGTVTSVAAGTGLSGGTITTSGTISLATSGVTAGTYYKMTVDTYGRVTNGYYADLSAAINGDLGVGSSDPTDADFYIAQYAGGGSTTTSYHRRSHSALYNYINGKLATAHAGLDKIGTVTSITVTGNNGLSGTGTVTTSGTITLSNAGVRSTTINGNYLQVNTNGTNADLTIPYATMAQIPNWLSRTAFDPNSVEYAIESNYGESGTTKTNVPSEFLYGSVLTMSARGFNSILSAQFLWDVRHGTSYPGWLWFRTKDSSSGWRDWTPVYTGLSLTKSVVTGLIGSTTYAPYNANGYLPLSGGTMSGSITISGYTAFGVANDTFFLGHPSYPVNIRSNGTTQINGNTLWHSGNANLSTVNWTCQNLYVASGAGIYTSGAGYAMLFEDTSNNVTVGVADGIGRFRSNNNNLIHIKAGTNYTIWDASNANLSTVPWACSTLTASGTIVSSANPGFRVNATANATALTAYVNGNRKWQIDTIDGDARWYSDGAGAYVLNIAANGNIGIGTGTTAPAYNLTVNGSIGCTTLTASGNISTFGYVSVGTGGANSYVGSDAANNIFLHNSSGYILIVDGVNVRRGATASTATLGTTTYPWAGITSTSADFRLTNFYDFHIFRNNSGGAAGITYYPAAQTTNYWNVGADPSIYGDTRNYRFYWYCNGAYAAYLTTTGSFVANGAITAGSASDARLKTNIQSLSAEAAKRIVMALNPVTFTWNEKATELYDQYKGDDLGMIAQEVEPYLPQAIGTIFEKYKRLDYDKVVTPLVKVAQDHETRLARAETRIAALERENAELKRKLFAC